MLTSDQVANVHRFAASSRGGFSTTDVDALVAHVVRTLASYEGTGTPGPDGLTAAALSSATLPSVSSEPGYPLLEVQDLLDEVHETLATYEQRGAFPATSWIPAADTDAPAGSGVLASVSVLADHQAHSAPLPTNMTPAVRALASVGGGSRGPLPAPAGGSSDLTLPATPSWADERTPARDYGMDADSLLVELQSVIAQSRARGSLEVTVQVPGQHLRVMRVVESSPGKITIVAQ
ncbi:hypothetical protein [Sanguibacter antarcticus]|uniref:DivIVA domain-containing protein n=1 Tax=Sanguibacter antarcticus TaxID=372484 RepID=A0A2A9E6W5_9MICO|nr:hypothetical protein [Sanguibacter antarcticus]PFG34583.1 hypothetical protein ATL42_2500 [Sanguibacter antarcticus]